MLKPNQVVRPWSVQLINRTSSAVVSYPIHQRPSAYYVSQAKIFLHSNRYAWQILVPVYAGHLPEQDM